MIIRASLSIRFGVFCHFFQTELVVGALTSEPLSPKTTCVDKEMIPVKINKQKGTQFP